MSKIDELIRELCPEGVPYKPLGELALNRDSERKPVTKSDRSAGEYPYFGANGIQDYVAAYIFDGTFLLIGEDGSVANADGSPVLNWAEGKIWVNNHAHVLEELPDGPLLRYLYFYLATIDVSGFVTGGTQKKINQANLNRILVPNPPLEVQREIVSILDRFTQLEADLEAELEARRTQYEVTRDRLLDFSGDLDLHPLAGSEQHQTLGNVRCLSLGDVAQYSVDRVSASSLGPETFVSVDNLIVNKKGVKSSDYVPDSGQVTKFSSGSVLVGNIRPYLRKIWLSDQEGGCSGDVLCINRTTEGEDLVTAGYLYHCLASENFFRFNVQNSKGAKMPRGDKRSILKFPLFLPPISVQIEIVSILDQLDALVNDITIGLPAEISARRKQYEYYRNKLLTFKELDAA